MIYTDMEHLGRYRGITPALDTAIAYLLEHGLEGLTSGRNEVDGENVYINRFAYTTMPEAETAFEAHRLYADIHLLAEGEEYIGITPMEPGKVLIAFPEDAHRVKINRGGPCHVEKAVVKVRV